MDGFPSGQRGQTVNLLRNASEVQILLRPLNLIYLVFAQLAQLVEQRTENPRVVGSIPTQGISMIFGSHFVVSTEWLFLWDISSLRKD